MNAAARLDFHARSDPAGLALVDDPSGRTWTWADLLADVERAQCGLAELGIGAGERLGLLTWNRPEFVVLHLACLRAGVIPALYNMRWGADELRHAVADADPVALVGEGSSGAVIEAALADHRATAILIPAEDGEPSPALERLLGARGEAPPAVDRADDDLAEIMYTSGTSGRPKGVLHHHGHHLANSAALIDHFVLRRGDVGLAPFPLFHQSGQTVWSVALGLGGPLVLTRRWQRGDFARLLREHRVTYTHLISTAVNDLAADRELETDPEGTLRLTLFGGGQTSDLQALAYEERFGGVLCSGYGRSEGGYCWEDPDRERRRFDRNGRPLRGTAELIILGPEGERLGAGGTGEIRMRGDSVSPGYWRRPDLDEVSFDADGFMLTGDLGSFDEEGCLTFRGRADRMIKSGGENVHPSEVEEALLRMPSVAAVAVVGIPDERLSERIAAAVVLRGADVDALETWCRENMAGFKRPRTIAALDELPLLGSGKVDYAAVTERLVATPKEEAR